jgi:hypothetical protein
VLYTLAPADCDAVVERRMAAGPLRPRGNIPNPGAIVPTLVVSPIDATTFNGQAFLDGDDALWLVAVREGEPGQQGTWHWPRRV